MSWIEHIKKVAAENNISYKDAMKIAGKTYNPTGETKQTRKKKSGDNTTKKSRKSMKSASASSASASPSASSPSSPTVEELLAQIKLCGKCKKQVDKLMKKKSLKGGNCCGPV